ncbi:unnamed protein product, partial [marine sediment metagenome]
VLDIDGTLSLTVDDDEYNDLGEDIKKYFSKITYKPFENKDITSDAWVMKRPYLDDFLDYIFEHFNVGVWSIGQPGYVNEIVKYLLFDQGHQPAFIYNFTNCHRCYDPIRFTKPLNKCPSKGYGIIIEDQLDVISEGDEYILIPEFDIIYDDEEMELFNEMRLINDTELLDLMDQMEVIISE